MTTVTLNMTPHNGFFTLIGVGQYGSLGNSAWELVSDPVIDGSSKETTWTFRSTAAITPGKATTRSSSPSISAAAAPSPTRYNFAYPMTASASAAATGYGTGTGWYQP